MARDFSPPMLRQLAQQETDEAYLTLLKIDHEELSTPIRVTSNDINTTSKGEEYISFGFNIVMPNDDEDKAPAMALEVDNTSREITQALREIAASNEPNPPTVTLQIVAASDPDTVEIELPDFTLQGADYNQAVVSGNLTIEDFASDPFPFDDINPSTFPGLF